MRTVVRRPFGLLGVGMILLALVATACSSTREPDQVHVLTWDGMVNPVMERYIDRGIATAERSDARAVLIRLDTPGGLVDSMRDIVKRIEASTVPVIVYVSPSGSQAASAGTFITMIAHVAAMAPNATIGAATPVGSDGSDIDGAMGNKVTNDMVAYGRGIAELRGRNADWAEAAIREAISANSNQAVEQNIVDFVATSVDDVLRQADGRQVQVSLPNGDPITVTLHTADAPVTSNNTSFFEQLLYLIADPNVAFLLLTLGGLALIVEIYSPGIGIGIFGVIALVLAYFSLGALPTNWAGAGLILFGIVLLAVEVNMAGFGAFGAGGIASILLGGLILTGSGETGYQVSRILLIGFGVIAALLLVTVLVTLASIRRTPRNKAPQLLGSQGTTRSELMPDGVVIVQGERWNASAEEGYIEEGAHILVTKVDGLRLQVKRDPAYIKLLPPSSAAPSGS